MSTMDPLIGRRLGGYEIKRLLGRGGMARVYKAYDEKLNRYAAIKVIEPHLIAGEDEAEYRDRFLREARAIARLKHPHIVGIYLYDEIDSLYFIAMEYVEGENLRQLIKENVRQGRLLPGREILRILRDVAGALDYAHEQDIIHRDVKPSNVIVAPDGKAILTDFGLALNAIEGTVGNTFGSVHYIAPEQAISSAKAVAQSDQYALAVIAYEMFTGRVPFDDASAMSVALRHISDPPPPPRQINPNIPPTVEHVLMRALDKDYQRRYASCQAFVQALDQAFQDAGEMPTSLVFPTVPDRPEETDGGQRTPVISMDDDAPTLRDLPRSPLGDPEDVLTNPVPYHVRERASRPRQPEPRRWLIALAVLLVVVGGAAVLLLAVPDLRSWLAGAGVAPEGTDVAAAAGIGTANAAVTDAPTATATTAAAAVSTAEVTAAPTDIPPMAEATEAVVDTPVRASATPEPEPTETDTPSPSPTPTHTATRSATQPPTSSVTPALALRGEDDLPLLLRYDGRTAVLYNRSPEDTLDVSQLQFLLFAPDEATGEIAEVHRFEAAEWGSLSPGLAPQSCLQVWRITFRFLPADEPPADMCETRTYFRATVRPFWVSEVPTDAYFEVRRGPVDVLAVCPVNQTGTFEEQRCAFDLQP